MNSWDNVNVLASGDGEAEPKIEEMEQDKFRVKNYIPQRYHPKYQKYGFIAIGVIVALIVVIVVAELCTKSHGTKVEGSDNMKNYRGKLVVLTNDTKLLQFDPKTKNLTLIFESDKQVADFDLHADQRVYWAEVINKTSTRLRVSLNNSLSNLIDDPRFQPRGMVLDHVTENLYVLDESAGNLVVVNIRTGYYNLLLSELINPRDIVLDPEEGLMFILQLSDSIIRAQMDGTGVMKLVSNTDVASLTLDPKRKRLYWIKDAVNIESSDYEGMHRQCFFNDTVPLKSLAFLDDRLYWFWPGHGHSTSLLSCKVSANDTCDDYINYSMNNLEDSKYIKGYSSTHGMFDKNPCKVNNRGCQHLCFLSSKNTGSCGCRMGWQINPDKTSCREIRDFVLYPHDGFVRVKSIDGSSNDLIWPTPYINESIKNKGEIDFDYDLTNDDFYFSDDSHIYKMKLKTLERQTAILSVNVSNLVIEDIAYDWYTGNMYFVQRSTTYTKRHSLMLFNVRLGQKYQKTLYTYKYDSTFGLQACPYAMVLHPAKHSMFFTAGENDRRFIQHASMNATGLHRIYNTFPAFVHEYRLIAVDYVKNRVYWIWDSDRVSVIKHANFDGTNVKVMSVDDVRYAKTIYVHQQWLYLSNRTSIWRVHKEMGGPAIRIAPKVDDNKRKIAGVRIISESVQSTGKENACGDEVGLCEQFCLNTDTGPVCSCKDGLSAGGSKCS